MQRYAESAIMNSQFEYSMWRPIVGPDELFLHFCRSEAFQMCITKYLRIRADIRNQSNNGDKMAYNLGSSAEEFIARLKENKLYSRF